MEPGTLSLAEEAEKQMQREAEQKFKDTSERIAADAEKLAKAENTYFPPVQGIFESYGIK